MRNAGFLSMGLALLIIQANLFRILDRISLLGATTVWATATVVDTWRTFRRRPGHARSVSTLRADVALPATVLLGYALLVSIGRVHPGRPIPALVLPLILFMGVHEYSLARGAAIAFVIGYATDVFGIAPVGLYTFTYVATFLLARAAGVRLAAQTLWTQAFLVGVFTMLQSTMVLVLLAIFGRDPWVPKCLYPLALPHAIATAAVTPLIFRLAQTLHSVSGGSPRTDIAGVSL
jgi:rod shape-determining protein MreD